MDEQRDRLSATDLITYNKTPLNITFDNIGYKVICKKKKTEKIILENVTGECTAGKLTAILGVSGAGKTSLLNILAGSKTKGVTGNILINGQDRNLNNFRWQSSYIAQESKMLPLLTTRETLNIAADLKLPTKMSRNDKNKIISEIVEILALQNTLDTRTSDLSGGELKRLSIGVELITNPPVMFFDEPTSGLDSVSSCQVMSHLQTLARGGRTIVCVIHQPSSRLFDMFNDLLLMSNGKSLYMGSLNDIIPVFESSGFVCPQYYNRADFVIEVATSQIRGDLDLLKNKNFLKGKSKSQDLISSASNIVDDISNSADSTPLSSDYRVTLSDEQENLQTIDTADFNIKFRNMYAVSGFHQFIILLKRSSLCTFRDLHLSRIRVLAHALVGVILGLIYYDIGNDASKIFSNAALLFFFILFIFFANSMPTILTFPLEASVFKREHQNNWYSLLAYFSSKMLADFPLQMICPTLFMIIAYVMSNQPCDAFRIAMVWLVCVMFTILSQLLGLVTGVVFSMQMGLFLLPALSIPMLIFSGFFLRFDDVPKYMQFFNYISQFAYGFEAIMLAVYGYDRPDLHCPVPYCHYKSSKKYLEEMDMDTGNFYKCIGVLGAWIVFLQISLFAALKFRVWRSK